MNKLKLLVLTAAVTTALYAPLTLAEAKTYALDPTHTSVIVSWNHFGFSHPIAVIPDASGELTFDDRHPEKSTVNVNLPLANINTFVPKLTEEFKNSADYFEIAKYPTATFRSTKVTPKGGDEFTVEGELTIKGIVKPVTLLAKLNKQGEQPMLKAPAIGFDAVGTLKRSDFNMTKYVPAVSDEITLTISTEAHGK